MSNDELETAAAQPNSSPTVVPFRRPSHTTHRAVRPRQLRATDPSLEPLRRQSRSIIAEVLADTNPDEGQVREQLRWHVENNPGQPEKALLDHLLTVAVHQEESA